MIKVTDNNNTIINKEGLVLLDFSASYCVACERLHPIIEELETEYPQINFFSLDVEDNLILRKSMGIKGLPTIIILNNGEKVEHITDFRPKGELVNIIKKYI